MDASNLSEEFANTVLPVTIFFAVLAIFGGLGNIFVLYVYRYKYPPGNFRTFVTSLAATDFVSCLFVFPSEIAGHRMWFSYPRSAVWFCKLKTGLFAVVVMTTSMILLLISIDRFRKVCRPFGSQINVQNAFTLCIASVILAVIMTSPIPILFGIQHENITYQGKTFEITSCEKDDAYKETLWMPIYLILLYYSPMTAFMITTTFLYSMILKKIFSRSFLRSAYSTPFKQTIMRSTEDICYHGCNNRNDNEIQPDIQRNRASKSPHGNFVQISEQNGTGRDQVLVKEIAQVETNKTQATDNNVVNEQTENEIENEIQTDQLTTSATGINQAHNYHSLSVSKHRITRKTIMMFVVTLIFNVTMLIYFCALFVIVRRQHIFEVVDTGTAAIFFLCWRVYFINHVINPVVYGLLDYRFREALTHKRSSRDWYQ